jgi:hypothetical protein
MKRRQPPPPVPTLSDAALERMERNVFAALDARAIRPDAVPGSRRRVLAFALAGAAIAAGVFTVREWRHASAPVTRAAEVAEAATEITTTASGSHIDIAGAALDVAPQSAVSVGGGPGGATVVVLERGAVTCEVARRTTRAPFVVQAGQTRVTVIGTRFTVRRVGDHASVSVEHGLVEVADTNMTELVHVGERFAPGEGVTRAPLASAEAEAPAPPPSAPEPAREEPPAPRPARAPHRRVVARADVHATEAPVAAPRVEEAATPPAAETAVEIEAPANAPATEGAPPRRSVQVLFELAAQLELKDPSAALRIYGELAASEDAWAASALFASARLEGERGQDARARELAAAYLRRFPAGPNADDARILLAAPR